MPLGPNKEVMPDPGEAVLQRRNEQGVPVPGSRGSHHNRCALLTQLLGEHPIQHLLPAAQGQHPLC